MPEVVRFGVSMDAELLAAFDELIYSKGYANRSEAIRDMVRESIVKHEWEDDSEPAVGALCFVYDHHSGNINKKLTSLQHDHSEEVTATLHVHLDHDNCLEVVILRGWASEIQELANRVISTKGVKHGQLVMTTTGQHLQ